VVLGAGKAREAHESGFLFVFQSNAVVVRVQNDPKVQFSIVRVQNGRKSLFMTQDFFVPKRFGVQ
jgi:hypothetical protein